jgi:hypothetical protein
MDDIEDRIRERAHRIWLSQGQPDGQAEAHWEEARRQIEAEVATWQNPAAGNPLPDRHPPADDGIPAIAADAAATAAITGVPFTTGATPRTRGAKDTL